MRVQQFRFCGMDMTVHSFNTVIVGTGAAGYSAAERLYQYGQTDIAMLTENILAGTSRNTGSDKQTYYKLSLSGSECDSVKDMAQVFFDGQCVDGEHALWQLQKHRFPTVPLRTRSVLLLSMPQPTMLLITFFSLHSLPFV